jgi:hypothetical protein
VDYTFVHSRVQALKPKARSRLLARLLLGPDVLLQHARGFVAGLLPDLEFRHPVVEGGGGETGAQGVGAIAVEVADAGALQCPLQNPRHRGRVQGRFLHVFPAVDLTEDRPALDAGLAQPLVERPDRAGTFGEGRVLGLSAPRDLDFSSLPLLIGLRPWQRNGDPLGVGLEVFAADCGQFRTPQAARESDQDQGPVPGGRQGTALLDIQHPPDEFQRDRRFAFLLCSRGLADSGVDLGQLAIGFHGAGGRQFLFLVPEGDGRQLAADGRNLGPAGGELRHVEPDGADGGGQRVEAGLAAPRREETEIRRVGALGGRAPGGPLVPEGVLGGVKQRVPGAEPVQGNAGGGQPGSPGSIPAVAFLLTNRISSVYFQ